MKLDPNLEEELFQLNVGEIRGQAICGYSGTVSAAWKLAAPRALAHVISHLHFRGESQADGS